MLPIVSFSSSSSSPLIGDDCGVLGGEESPGPAPIPFESLKSQRRLSRRSASPHMDVDSLFAVANYDFKETMQTM